jgi:hypothetical protein
LQVIRSQRGVQRASTWHRLFTLPPVSECFVALASAPTSSSQDSTGFGGAGHGSGLQHTAQHILLACTNRQLLLFHAADATRVFLDAPLPTAISSPATLALHLWPLTLPVALPVQPAAQTDASQAAASSAAAEHVCVALVCVGCRASGHTAVQPFAVLPAAHGLAVRHVAAPAAHQNADGLSSLLRAFDKRAKDAEAPPDTLAKLQAVPLHQDHDAVAPVQLRSHTSDKARDDSANGASPSSAAPVTTPWTLTSSAAAAWLGPVQVLGAPLRTLPACAPEAAALYQELEQLHDGPAPAAAATIALRDAPDSAGVISLTPADMQDGPEEAELCLTGPMLAVWAQGHDGGCFAALQRALPQLHVARATFNGSPVLERYAWQARGPHTLLTDWAGVRVCAAAPRHRQRRQMRVVKASAEALPSASPLKTWGSPEATCTGALQRWHSCWDSGGGAAADAASRAAWAQCLGQSDALATDHASALVAGTKLIGNPFHDASLPAAEAIELLPATCVAVREALRGLKYATPVQSVWAAVLRSEVAAAARGGAKRKANRCQPRGRCPTCSQAGDCVANVWQLPQVQAVPETHQVLASGSALQHWCWCATTAFTASDVAEDWEAASSGKAALISVGSDWALAHAVGGLRQLGANSTLQLQRLQVPGFLPQRRLEPMGDVLHVRTPLQTSGLSAQRHSDVLLGETGAHACVGAGHWVVVPVKAQEAGQGASTSKLEWAFEVEARAARCAAPSDATKSKLDELLSDW